MKLWNMKYYLSVEKILYLFKSVTIIMLNECNKVKMCIGYWNLPSDITMIFFKCIA